MFDLKFRGKLIAGLTAACFVLIFVAALTYYALAHNTVDRQWVTHTLLVLERLSDLQSQIANAESGQRSFLLTGDKAYLEAYEESLTAIPESLSELRQLTSDNPVQQRNLDGLDDRVSARLTILKEVIGTRNRSGLAASVAAILTGTSKLRMHEIRSDISMMKTEERRLLVIRSNALDLSTHQAKLFISFGEALGFCFLLLAGVVIQQEMSKRRRSEEEIRILNADLERRVAERTSELSARSKDLERSNMDLQQFAYVASHDLQEPLRTISSFTQLLAKRYRSQLDDKAREFIDFAVDGCKRMQTLISDLLAFSRVGAQAQPLRPVRCDAVLDRVLKNLRFVIQESGAEIQREPLPVLIADEVQLAQLLQNLIVNAIKFRSQQAPCIHISAERKDAACTIMVRDNGIGVAPEHYERIFVIFQRLHTQTQYPGTGIGLAVCKKIVERHGGRISIQPAPQGGSIFSFTMTAGEISHANSTEEQTHGELRINAPAH